MRGGGHMEQPPDGVDDVLSWWDDDEDHHVETWTGNAQSYPKSCLAFIPSYGKRDWTPHKRQRDDYKRDGSVLMAEKGVTPLAYLQSVMEGEETPTGHQMQAAVAILPYRHRKQPVAVENSGPDGTPIVSEVRYTWGDPNK